MLPQNILVHFFILEFISTLNDPIKLHSKDSYEKIFIVKSLMLYILSSYFAAFITDQMLTLKLFVSIVVVLFVSLFVF